MGNVLVLYDSATGNTRAMARLVADRFTLHYGAGIAGEPRSDQEKEACLRLGQRLAQWVRVYADGERQCAGHIGARRGS